MKNTKVKIYKFRTLAFIGRYMAMEIIFYSREPSRNYPVNENSSLTCRWYISLWFYLKKFFFSGNQNFRFKNSREPRSQVLAFSKCSELMLCFTLRHWFTPKLIPSKYLTRWMSDRSSKRFSYRLIFVILRYTLDGRNQQFYRGIWSTKSGKKMIAYISQTPLDILQELQSIELLMDGTFKILPKHMQFSQLYIISFMYGGRAYPFAFVFMEDRKIESYDCLFVNLFALCKPNTSLKVMKIMTDYEKAVRNSARKFFKRARIAGQVLCHNNRVFIFS